MRRIGYILAAVISLAGGAAYVSLAPARADLNACRRGPRGGGSRAARLPPVAGASSSPP